MPLYIGGHMKSYTYHCCSVGKHTYFNRWCRSVSFTLPISEKAHAHVGIHCKSTQRRSALLHWWSVWKFPFYIGGGYRNAPYIGTPMNKKASKGSWDFEMSSYKFKWEDKSIWRVHWLRLGCSEQTGLPPSGYPAGYKKKNMHQWKECQTK